MGFLGIFKRQHGQGSRIGWLGQERGRLRGPPGFWLQIETGTQEVRFQRVTWGSVLGKSEVRR